MIVDVKSVGVDKDGMFRIGVDFVLGIGGEAEELDNVISDPVNAFDEALYEISAGVVKKLAEKPE